jgi:hypothetical protein
MSGGFWGLDPPPLHTVSRKGAKDAKEMKDLRFALLCVLCAFA